MQLVWILSLLVGVASGNGVADAPFVQEWHASYSVGRAAGCDDVRAVAVDGGGAVWAATGAGVYRLEKGNTQWEALMMEADAGPAFDIVVDRAGTAWVGAWNGLYRSTPDGLERIKEVDCPIAALCVTQYGVVGLGDGGIWHVIQDKGTFEKLPCSRHFRAALPDGGDGLWIATGMGLYHHADTGHRFYQSQSEIVGPEVRDVAYASDGNLWAGGFGGVTVYTNGNRTGSFTPAEGLPSLDVRCVTPGPQGAMWVGTDLGVARYDGQRWSLRHSKRWLADDDVRDIAFDGDGTAWIATGAGVSAIKRRTMTLAQKADHFLEICLARHVRAPGLVEKCRLEVPGDTSTPKPRDDDNDGQYTSMYLAMESFRYAATGDPQAKANAKKAFEALRFLQTVTETPGFVARTVIPSSWTSMADPNRKISDRQWAEMVVDNPRERRIETRWHPSRDGKWLWKGDTSSDEITGHMYGYLFYYDLVADAAERRHVAAHVSKIVDYIIDGGYVLKGVDGTHTKWGVWAPQRLNHDPDWAPDRAVNSVEILSYLKLAHHMSGRQRYQDEYLSLLGEHGYADNVKRPKNTHPAMRTHIDDELLALAYPCLLLHEDDPKLQRLYRASLDHWYAVAQDELSPYFDFTHSSCSGRTPQLETAVAFLRDASLDLVRWTVDSTRRADVRIVRTPEWEHVQIDRMLPVSERGVIRWDENPWRAVQGDGGHTESDGVWWLLPYWMGRYYGYIQPAQ
jgi:hypothetical protein